MAETFAKAPVNRRQFLTAVRPSDVLEKFGLPLLLLLVIIFFSVNPSTGALFTSAPNIQNILANQSVTGLIALAMVIPLVCGYFDLSAAAIAGISNVTVAAAISNHGAPLSVAILLGLGVGLLAGAINAFLVAVLKLDGFICTFGTYTLMTGLLQWYTKGQTISNNFPPSFGDWGSAKELGIARPFILLIVVALILWYLVDHTPFGRRLVAIGANEAAARLAGIRVDRGVFVSYLLSGFIAGIAGVLLTSRSAGADATSATSFLFPAFAAVFLGRTAIQPGFYNVWGTMFGVFLVAISVNGLTFLGAQSWVTAVFNGTALIVSIGIAVFSTRVRESRARRAVESS